MTDLLVVTALTEEAQVVRAVLDAVATATQNGDVRLYDYVGFRGRKLRVAVASAHQMGAVNMGVFAAPLFHAVRPRSATLVGIAASAGQSTVELGDVPFSSHVLSYDDIAVEQGRLTFRTEGFPVDPAMRRAVGELRTSPEYYVPWQEDCRVFIRNVVSRLNQLRRTEMLEPNDLLPPHLIVDITAGGPFLLRDSGFRDSLTKPQEIPALGSIQVTAPVHPKLVSVEMESHGFMRAAREHEVPATVLKGISDVGDDEKASLEKRTGGFYRAYACSNAILAALHILRVRDELEQLRDASTSASHDSHSAGKIDNSPKALETRKDGAAPGVVTHTHATLEALRVIEHLSSGNRNNRTPMKHVIRAIARLPSCAGNEMAAQTLINALHRDNMLVLHQGDLLALSELGWVKARS